MMYLGKDPIGIMNNAPLPSFINNMESGDIIVENDSAIWVQLKNTTLPKAILVFNNDFDFMTEKANKEKLGAVAAWLIAGNAWPSPSVSGWISTVGISGYAVNWGNNTNGQFITNRSSYTEQRGIKLFDPQLHRFYLQGFGTGDYDFKYNTTYHWIALF